MHSLKMQPFVPPAVQQTAGRKHLGYRMLIVGAQGVGKYCLHHQFVYACFPSIRDPFFDSETPQMLWKSDGNDKFAFQIHPTRMDISRPEDVPHSQHLYPATRLPVDVYRFKDANGMILVYNIDSRSSFDALTHLIDARMQDSKSDSVEPKVLCIIGNKLDKSRDKRKILCLEGEALASKLGCPYIECSAKEGKGLDKVKNAVIKSMESQRSQLQYAQQQRDRAAQGSRIFNQKASLMRRLSGGNLTRSSSETQRSTDGVANTISYQSNSSQQITRGQRHRNRAIISPSSRYKGGLLASSLSSEDRIDEEDEETESDEKSRSSSQQSSNTSTTSKQSGVTITPPSNASSIRASFSHRLTIERLPPAAMVSLSPVGERPQEIVRSFSDLSSYTSTGVPKQKHSLSITTPSQVSNLGNLSQYRRGSKEEKQEGAQVRTVESSAASSRVQSPQNIPDAQSLPNSRVHSPEFMDYTRSRNFHEPVHPVQPFQLPQLEFSGPLSPTSEEKRKLDEERAQLEEEKQKLRQEMQELEQHQIKLEERRRIDLERRAIEEERKKIVEERRRVEEERQNLKEAKRLLEEEEAQWRYQQDYTWDESSTKQHQTLDEQFRGLSPEAEFRDDSRQEEIRRHHQEQLQQEQQRDLQLKSTTSSPSSAYSVQRDYFPVQEATLPTVQNHPLRGNPISSPTSPQQRPIFSSRSSVRSPADVSPRSHSRAEVSSATPPTAQNDGPSISSPPQSPDITQTFRRRLLGKKEPKKEVSSDQRETLKFLRDELGIAMPQIPPKSPQPRSPRALLLPPGTTIAAKNSVTQTERLHADGKPKLPFPGRYI